MEGDWVWGRHPFYGLGAWVSREKKRVLLWCGKEEKKKHPCAFKEGGSDI